MHAIGDEYDSNDQAVAICMQTWRDRDKGATGNDMDRTTILSSHMELVKAVRDRTGGAIYCASAIVNRIVEELGGGKEYRNDLKRAGKRLAIGGAEVEKRLKDSKSLTALLPKEAIESGIEFPGNTLLGFVNVITTPAEDREKDVLETAGAVLSRRMSLLWQHLHVSPLGKMVHVLEHTPKVLRVATALLDLNQLSHDCAILIEADALSISHGFRAMEWEDRKGPDGKKPTQAGSYGFRVTKFEIMEESVVSVPANVEAEIELWSRGKLKSEPIKRHAAALRDKMPLRVPVEIDLRLNGQKLNGHVSGSVNGHKLFDQNPRMIKEVLEASTPDNKSYGMCLLDGSWEAVQCQLCGTAKQFLQASGVVPDIGYREVWVVGTFDGEAILCAEACTWSAPAGTEEYEYFRCSWSMDGDMPQFTGSPEKVELSLTVKALERSPLYARKHPEPAHQVGQRFVVTAANDEPELRKMVGVCRALLGSGA